MSWFLAFLFLAGCRPADEVLLTDIDSNPVRLATKAFEDEVTETVAELRSVFDPAQAEWRRLDERLEAVGESARRGIGGGSRGGGSAGRRRR